MLIRIHFFPGFCLLLLGLGLQVQILRLLWDRYSRRLLVSAALASTALLVTGYMLEFHRFMRLFPVWWSTWLECVALVETIALTGLYLALLAWRRSPDFKPARRGFIKAAGAGLAMAPLGATAFGIVQRDRFRVSEVKIPIPYLPKDLDGLRIVQVTDIHLSPFLSEQEFARAIDMANETRANLPLGAPADGVLVSEEFDFAGVHEDAAENHRSLGRAAETQIRVGLDVVSQGGFHFQVAGTGDTHIELDSAQVLVGGGGRGNGLGGCRQQSADVGARVEGGANHSDA